MATYTQHIDQILSRNSLTDLEKAGVQSIAKWCFDDACASIDDIAGDTGLTIPQVKGVVGSLVKKGLIETEDAERGDYRKADIYILIDGQPVGFGCDEFDK